MSCPVCGEFDHKCACGEPEDQLDPSSPRIPITSESAIVKRGLAQPDEQNSITDQVKAFRELFGYPIRTVPTVPPEDESRLHLRIIADEFCELLEAHGVTSYREQIMAAIRECRLDVDMIGVADACGDIDFTVEGLRQCYGIPRQGVADEVSRSNLEKEGGEVVDGKQMKPAGWRPPDIEGVLRGAGWRP